mgnify:CR=1 FL=1
MLNLFYPSKRFCAACQGWDKYDEQEMSVILRPAKRSVIPRLSSKPVLIHSSQLPFYCFPDGQPKPKKKGKRGQQNVSSAFDCQPVITPAPDRSSKLTRRVWQRQVLRRQWTAKARVNDPSESKGAM